MKINLIVIDECGTDYIAETLTAQQQEVLGEHLDGFIAYRIAELRNEYPEAQAVYREDVKSHGELLCEAYHEAFEENLRWALAHEDELDGYDPEEWADDTTREEFNREWGMW